MLFGFDFSLIALIGIVKKNGIMLVDFAIEAQRNRGLAPLDAIREACLLRFRPIMMTTMAALLGGVPLMLGAGTGGEIRQPLGYAIVGGLIVSQALTLYTTPVVFLYPDCLNAWFPGPSRPAPARMGESGASANPTGCRWRRGRLRYQNRARRSLKADGVPSSIGRRPETV